MKKFLNEFKEIPTDSKQFQVDLGEFKRIERNTETDLNLKGVVFNSPSGITTFFFFFFFF